MKTILNVICLLTLTSVASADIVLNGQSLNSLRTQAPATKAVLASEIPKIESAITTTLTTRFRDPVPGSIRDGVATALRNLQASLNPLFVELNRQASFDSSNLTIILQLVDTFSPIPNSGVAIDASGNYILTGQIEDLYVSTSMSQGVANSLATYNALLADLQRALSVANAALAKLPQGNSNVKLGVSTFNEVASSMTLILSNVAASKDLMSSTFPH